MDTLALAVIAIGVVAAIGVVLVAMSGGETKSEGAAERAPTAAAPARARARRKPAPARPTTLAPAPQVNGYARSGEDPLVAGFMQVVSTELAALRQQQEAIDQRLKMINGIAELMHEMQGGSASTGNHVSSAANHTASRG